MNGNLDNSNMSYAYVHEVMIISCSPCHGKNPLGQETKALLCNISAQYNDTEPQCESMSTVFVFGYYHMLNLER